MKYLLVLNTKTGKLLAVVAAETDEEADAKLGMLIVELKELKAQIGDAEIRNFNNLLDVNTYLLASTPVSKSANTDKPEPTSSDLQYELNAKLTHGLFKHRTLREAINENPSWVLWSAGNVPFFNPSADVTYMAWAKCNEQEQKRYMQYSGMPTTKTSSVVPAKATMYKEVQQVVAPTDEIDDETDDLPF